MPLIRPTGQTSSRAGGGRPVIEALESRVLLSAAPAVSSGWYHTAGSRIVDANGNTAVFNGINWFGFETTTDVVQGLWARNMESVLAQVHSLGFNLLRIPYSDDILKPGTMPSTINYSLNPDLMGLSSLQLLDRLVQEAGSLGMKVILDRHRPDASGQSALWYTSSVSEQTWISDLQALAGRYASNPTVIGFDLHNEPHDPATWGSGDVTSDWRLAAERAGDAVLSVNPRLLICVEGIQTYKNDATWWGGNLEGVAAFPVQLSVPNQLVYSIHEYGPEIASQFWFFASNFPNNLPALWDKRFGYVAEQNTAPVWVGEFGGPEYDSASTPKEIAWETKFISYIEAHQLPWSFWDLNPNSSGTGGLLENDWTTVDPYKLGLLSPLLSPPPTLVSAVSRKAGAPAGPTDINLPVGGAAGIESRAGGPTQLVLTFSAPIVQGPGFAVSLSSGTLASTSVNGSTLTVDLSGAANAQTLVVSLTDVRDAGSGASGNVTLEVGVLAGDANGDGKVDVSDLGILATHFGTRSGAAPAQGDFTGDGAVDVSDLGILASDFGKTLAPPPVNFAGGQIAVTRSFVRHRSGLPTSRGR